MMLNLYSRLKSWFLNLLLGRKDEEKTVNLDKAANDFVKDVFNANSYQDDPFVEDLDQEHFDSLAKEVDPLEGTNEIPADSVKAEKADIDSVGQPSQQLKTPRHKAIVRPDSIRKGTAKIHNVVCPHERYDAPPPRRRRRK